MLIHCKCINVLRLLKAKLLLQPLNCADRYITQFGGFSYARSALQLFKHFLVFLLLCLKALSASYLATEFATIGNVTFTTTVKAELDILTLHFSACAEYRDKDVKERIPCAVGLKDA